MIAKKYRIPREKIPYLLRKGNSLSSRLFIFRYNSNNENFPRFRTIVSRKIDPKAVKRNYLRRQIYEAVRKVTGNTPDLQNLDIILIPKKQISKSSFEKISEDLKQNLTNLPPLHGEIQQNR